MMNWDTPGESSYSVEVSGWDSTESFFVESSTLEWSSKGNRSVSLRHAIREGSVVFIRLSQAISPSGNFPIAFQAEAVSSRDERGMTEVSLTQLHPRGKQRDTSDAPLLVAEEIHDVLKRR
jgi:hypothetical protein